MIDKYCVTWRKEVKELWDNIRYKRIINKYRYINKWIYEYMIIN